MSVCLIKDTEYWRADTESEALAFINQARAEGNVVKYSNEYKEVTVKGEVVDSYYKITLSRNFDDMKEPLGLVTEVNYIQNNFPSNSKVDDEEESL